MVQVSHRMCLRFKGTNFIMRVPPLWLPLTPVTSKSPYLQRATLKVRGSIYEFWGDTNIQFLTGLKGEFSKKEADDLLSPPHHCPLTVPKVSFSSQAQKWGCARCQPPPLPPQWMRPPVLPPVALPMPPTSDEFRVSLSVWKPST